VLTDVPLEARVMNEEPFGPIALMRTAVRRREKLGTRIRRWSGGPGGLPRLEEFSSRLSVPERHQMTTLKTGGGQGYLRIAAEEAFITREVLAAYKRLAMS
jgi:hypothetical protein